MTGTQTKIVAEPQAGARDTGVNLPYDDEISLWAIGAILLRKSHVALAVGLIVLAAGTFVVLREQHDVSYTTTVLFMPDGGAVGNRGMSGVAEQFGLSAPASGNSAFYADLLRSRTVLRGLAETPYPLQTDSGVVRRSLAEIAGVESTDPEMERAGVVDWLRSRLNTQVLSTGVVRLSVTAPDAELAREIASRLIDELHAYNVSTRQSHAATERRFIEDRHAALQGELRDAEGRLAEFLRDNRQFERSPELRLVYDRLQREISLKQQTVVTLAQAFEQARIEEVRNTPVVTIIEEPVTPVRPDARSGRAMKFFWVLVLAMFVGPAVALVVALAERARQQPSAPYREFESALQEVKMKLQRVLPARFGRREGGGGRRGE